MVMEAQKMKALAYFSEILNKSKENGSSMVDLHNQSLYSKEASISKNIKEQQQSTVEGGPPSLRKKKVSF